MRRVRVRLAGLALMAAGALVIGLAPSADAATLGTAGWWWRANDGPGGTPKPPHVPDGGLYVAGTPDGASAVAALRFTLDEGETDPVLTLDEADPAGSDEESPSSTTPAPAPVPVAPPSEGGSTPKELDPVILACQSGSKWKASDGGKWGDKPKVACGIGKVTGEREGSTWTWDLSDLQVKTALDVVLVPGKVQGVGSTFQVAFEKPDDTSLQTVPGISPVPIVPAGEDLTPAPGGGSAGLDGAGDEFSASSDDPGTSFDAGDDTSDTGPALSEDEQGLDQDAAAVENAQEQAKPASSTTGKNARTLGIAVLVAGAALALFANQQPVPALRKLGPFGDRAGAAPQVQAAEPASGGLGRFARARSGPAPKL